MKLAVFTPLSPARTGIADYSQALLPELARHLELEVFVDEGYEPEGFAASLNIPVRPACEFRPQDFDETLYQMGNNPFHIYAYDAALRNPGILLLHELNLHHLVADALIKRDRWDEYMRAVEDEGGTAAMPYARRVRALEVGPDYDGLAMNKRVIESGKAVIVHSRYMAAEIRAAHPSTPIGCIPHGAWIPEVNRNRRRERLGIDERTTLIGVFGFLKPYKRIRESLRAMRRLVRVEPRVQMILVGEAHPDLPVERMIEDMGLGEHVRVLGFTPIDEFVEYLGACDICLNLRYPTAGETSGTLLRALGLGRAAIVSNVGSFADLPDDICLKVPVDESETDLIFEYLNLLVSRPEVRKTMGARARDYVARECSWAGVGKRFAEYLEAVHEGRAGEVGWSEPGGEAESMDTSAATTSGVNPQAAAAQPTAEEGRTQAPLPPAEPAGALAEYIRGFCHERPDDAGYVETHLTRLVRTLELTPAGGPGDEVLEMGAYMHITPALQSQRGYSTVRGCYLGEPGRTDRRRATSSSSETFECEVDLFDAEKHVYPYEDGRFATVLCCELLEHLYDDPMHLTAEVNRILRNGGHLVLTTPNVCSLRAISAMLLNYHPGLFHHYVVPDADGVRDPRHAREYAPRDVQALLEASGFEVVALESGPYIERRSQEHEWVRRLLERHELPDHLRGDCLFAVGRKVGPVRERYPAALYSGEE